MKVKSLSKTWCLHWVLAMILVWGSSCRRDGDRKLLNEEPGNNDLNVVVALGDSITEGDDCDCTPYPARLSAMIGKSVHNAGVAGSRAVNSVDRVKSQIKRHRPAYMLILYGINDIIHSHAVDGIVGALEQMVIVCKENQVVPVLATYPVPIHKRYIFASGTIALNQGIRYVASIHGIHCVDLEREFNQNPVFYDEGGLHPNDEGTQLMALAFADLF